LTLAITDYATVNLVDLFEAVIDHDGTQDFAANTTCAVGDHRFVLNVVILTAFDFSYEIMGCLDIWDNGVLKSANFGFKSVTTVKKDHLIASFGD
jgi:hypothetical protein